MRPYRGSFSFRSLSSLAALASLLFSALVGRGSVRLNGPLARPAVGGIVNAALTPDGRLVVYTGDLHSDDVWELYVSPADGSRVAQRLNGPLVPGGDVLTFRVSPDGSHVVYRADELQDGLVELFAAPIDGSHLPVRLNGELVAGGGVDSFEIRPDGRWVAYRAEQDEDGVRELYVVPIDRSSEPAKVNGPMVAGGDVSTYRFAPDGGRLAYVADQFRNFVDELFCTDDTGRARRVNLRMSAGSDVQRFEFTPDGKRLTYLADQDNPTREELYSAPVDGRSPPVRISHPLTSTERVTANYRLSPDGRRAVYLVSSSLELFSTAIDGSEAPALLASLQGGWSEVRIAIDPSSTQVVFLDQTSVPALRSVPIDGGSPAVLLHPALASGGVTAFEIAGERVVFRMQVGFAGSQDLHTAPIDGSGPAIQLNPPLPAGGEVTSSFRVPARSDRVVYLAEQISPNVDELFSIPLDGSAAPTRLSGPMTLGGEVILFEISLDGGTVLYRADQDVESVEELHCAPVDGGSPAVRVNTPLLLGPVTGDVGAFVVGPDGRTVVYAASQDGDDAHGLYSVPIDRGSAPVGLHADLADSFGSRILGFAISPDGEHVLHSRSPFGQVGVFMTPLDGSTPAETLAWLDSTPATASFAFSVDGAWTLYSETMPSASTRSYLMRLDGSVAPRQLGRNGNLALFAPTSSHLVYRERSNPGVQELFSIRLDGSGSIVRLDGPLVAGGNVVSAVITPDGSHVLYVADQEVDGLFELYRVPIDRGTAPVRLSAGAVGSGVSPDLAVTADSHVIHRQVTVAGPRILRTSVDGSSPPQVLAPSAGEVLELANGGRVAFLDDGGLGGPLRLHSVAADGTAAAVDLSGALVPGGAIASFRLAPDGGWAVYLADQDVRGKRELYGVPLDGSSARIRLDATPAGSDVLEYEIASDSASVAYRAGGPDGIHVYRVPIDGSRPPARMDPPLVAGGDVIGFRLAAEGRAVVYVADQDVDEVFELFASSGGRAPRPTGTPARTVLR